MYLFIFPKTVIPNLLETITDKLSWILANTPSIFHNKLSLKKKKNNNLKLY